VKTRKTKKKNGYAQKYRQKVRGIRGVSPGEETEGYGARGGPSHGQLAHGFLSGDDG